MVAKLSTQKNKQTYESKKIVNYYSQLNQLQPAEAAILKLFASDWYKIKMLDIGVGGGRTTQHFAPLVNEYIGVDYSPPMIISCKKKFQVDYPNALFQVADARNLSQFADNTFDFILFSFNGIDYVKHSDRLKILYEINRVAKPGGYYFFSSHNLTAITQAFKLKQKLSLNPIKTYTNLFMFGLLKIFNRQVNLELLENSQYLMIRDESHNFRLNTYYVKPQEQLQQLSFGFENISIYSWQGNEPLTDNQDPAWQNDMWLYYLCSIKK